MIQRNMHIRSKIRASVALHQAAAAPWGANPVSGMQDFYPCETGLFFIMPVPGVNQPNVEEWKRLPNCRYHLLPWNNIATVEFEPGSVIPGLPGPICKLEGTKFVPVDIAEVGQVFEHLRDVAPIEDKPEVEIPASVLAPVPADPDGEDALLGIEDEEVDDLPAPPAKGKPGRKPKVRD